MGQGRMGALTAKKYPHLTEMHLTGFPIKLKAEIMAIAEDQGSSITEFIKNCMRPIIDKRKTELGHVQLSELEEKVDALITKNKEKSKAK
jgi:hypothetical protein